MIVRFHGEISKDEVQRDTGDNPRWSRAYILLGNRSNIQTAEGCSATECFDRRSTSLGRFKCSHLTSSWALLDVEYYALELLSGISFQAMIGTAGQRALKGDRAPRHDIGDRTPLFVGVVYDLSSS
jgi:hypothetical protein